MNYEEEITTAYNKWFYSLLDSEMDNLYTEDAFEAGYRAALRFAIEKAKEYKLEHFKLLANNAGPTH